LIKVNTVIGELKKMFLYKLL